jgi:RHS repeat-associated protein
MLSSAATISASGTTTYHHRDGLGSIIMITDASGSVVERYRYDVFGHVTILDAAYAPRPATAHNNRFLYTGREWLAQLELYDYRNRTYSPNLGRFLQTDPIRFDAGDLNLYRYVVNNMVNITDPLGLEDFRMFHPSESWRRQFDSGPRTYDIGAHGNPNAVFDEHGNPMSPQDLLNRVKNDPNFQKAKKVRLWACEVGKGKNSFAQQFANISGKPTSGPNQIFWEHGRFGTIAPMGPNGQPPDGIGGFLGRMFSWNWRNFNPQ